MAGRIVVLHVDGGSRGNPGPAGAGVVLLDAEGQPLFEAAYFLGRQTNNAAEYLGLIRGLERAAEAAPAELHIRSDSELLVRQITGEYRVKNPRLQQLFTQAQRLLLGFRNWQIRHVRREKNVRADALANLAMDRGADVVVLDAATGATASAADYAAAPPVTAPVQTEPHASNHGTTPPAVDQDASAVDARLIVVRVSRKPAADACPAGGCAGEFSVGAVLPAGLCIYAAHAMLPTLLAIQSADPDEFHAIPTLTVSCSRNACGATFQLTPERRSNGQHTA